MPVPADVTDEHVAAVRAAPVEERTELFKVLVAQFGAPTASRIWLAAFAATDAAPT